MFGGESEDDHIDFFDKEKLGFTNKIEEHAEEILKEINGFLASDENETSPYFNKQLVSKFGNWQTSSFMVWCWPVKKNMRQVPITSEILTSIPGITAFSISHLKPQTEIKPHRGDTNAIMRCHLGISIPEQSERCQLKVRYTSRSWEEGKLLVFNDAARHEAWNLTDEPRTVLLIDVVRPEFRSKKRHVCAMVLSGLVMQALIGKLQLLGKLPTFLLAPVFIPVYLITRLALFFKNL